MVLRGLKRQRIAPLGRSRRHGLYLSAGSLVLAATAVLSPIRVGAAPGTPDSGTDLVDETFTGATLTNPYAWTASGSACLTGANPAVTVPAGQLGPCTSSTDAPTPGVTPGFLQLTSAGGDEVGSLLFNEPLPSSAGIDVTFNTWQYGGTGADGIGLFLVNGTTTPVTAGASGGSLGYAQKTGIAGAAGGYLGLGLDTYGNYYNDGEGRGTGCPAGQQSPVGTAGTLVPNSVSLRGPGSGTQGYCFLASTATAPPNPTTTLPGSLRGTDDTTASERSVHIVISPAPNPIVTVSIDFHDGNGFQQVLSTPAPPNPPPTYKFGFTASTGGSTDIHLLTMVHVQTVNPLPSLNLVKQVVTAGIPLPPPVGQVVPYQFVVTNGGTVPVDDVTIADPLVTDATCPLSTLEPNQTETCTGSYVLTAADLAQGSLENTAVADGTTLNGAVSSPPSSATLGFGPRLALTKAITTAAPYSLGQMLTYRYDVTNTGSVTLAGLNVVDSKIPAGVVCPTTTLTPAPAYGSSESCTASMVLTAAALSPDGTLTNTAYATAASSQGAATSPTATVTVPVAADVGLTKTVDNPAPLLGQTVTFTVTATNYGPATATSLAVSDPLPNGLVFVGANPSEGTYVAATGLWTVGALAVGAASTLTLQATATVPTTIVNTATVSHLDEPDLTPANDSASAAVSPIQPTADMAVTKTVDNATPTVGDTVTFTVTATNNGPFADPGVALTDTAGPALSVTGGTPSAGSFDPASGVWTLGNVAVGAVATLQVTATVLADGPSTNVVAVTAAGLPDPFPANNSATATIVAQPQTADVGITKVPSTTAPTTTAPFTYTLVAYNDGPDPAADVTATDLLPAGLNYVSSSATLGTYDPTTGVWLLGQLANGQRATLTITVQPTTPESVTNTATITSTTLDPNPGNNSASVAVAVAAVADLAVTKQVSDSRPLHGAEVTYTVTVTDLGPQDATGVALSDPLPTGVTYVSAAPSQGTYDPVAGTWTVGPLGDGNTATISVVVTASAVGTFTNTASVSASDQIDPDLSNNSASATIETQPVADLAVVKTTPVPAVRLGQVVPYTVTLTNNGPDAATNVAVTDIIPAGLSFLSAATSEGTYDATSEVWSVNGATPLGVGASATLTYTATAGALGPVENTAVISHSDQFDTNPTDNSSSALITVSPPEASVSITKTASAPSVQIGGEITYTITAANAGPDPALGVAVDDSLPPGAVFVSADSGCVANGSVVHCPLATLLAGGSAVVHITVALTATGTATNTAQISTSTVNTDPTITAHAAVVVSPVPVVPPPPAPPAPPIDPSAPVASGPMVAAAMAQGSSLAFTGFDPTGIAEVAALLLGAGTAVLALGRRRRCRAGAGPAP